jgi:hypothetical protein
MLIKKSKIGLFFLSLTLIAVSSAVLGDAQHLYSDSSFKPASSLIEFELSDDNKPFDNVDDFLSTHVYHNKNTLLIETVLTLFIFQHIMLLANFLSAPLPPSSANVIQTRLFWSKTTIFKGCLVAAHSQ